MLHSGRGASAPDRAPLAPVSRGRRVRSALILLLLAALVSACRSDSGRSYIDLLHSLPAAKTRSLLPPADAIAVVESDVEGTRRMALRTCGASRVTWNVRLPARAVIRMLLARDAALSPPDAHLALRVGIASPRYYQMLFRQEFPPVTDGSRTPWTPVTISLSRFSGWQWSIFYRPWEMAWDIIFSADAEIKGGRAACGEWAVPHIESDSR